MLLADDLVQAGTPLPEADGRGYNEVGGNLVAVMDVPKAHTDRYGILKTGKESGRLVEALGLVEKPKPDEAPSTLSIIGRYILQPDVFAHLDKQSPGAGGEIQLTDAMALMCGRGRFHGYRFEGGASIAATRPASSKPTSPTRSVIRRSAARCGTPCSPSRRT